jgi:hypothetical protein
VSDGLIRVDDMGANLGGDPLVAGKCDVDVHDAHRRKQLPCHRRSAPRGGRGTEFVHERRPKLQLRARSAADVCGRVPGPSIRWSACQTTMK